MATQSSRKTETAATNTAVPTEAVSDKVAMLSLNKDGTPDQVNPEIIGDKGFATEATKRQFAEQAVSAADDARRTAEGAEVAAAETVEQDPAIAERQKEHDKVSTAAEKRAETVVDGLSQA